MGRVGSCFDCRGRGVLLSSLEWEVLSRHDFPTTAQARATVIDWCYGLDNHQRRHSGAAGQSPINYENTALNREAVMNTGDISGQQARGWATGLEVGAAWVALPGCG
jgi:hypothetical protein